jgi:hypothetical protein
MDCTPDAPERPSPQGNNTPHKPAQSLTNSAWFVLNACCLTEPFDILLLPDELVLKILSSLYIEDLCNLVSVRACHYLASNDSFAD